MLSNVILREYDIIDAGFSIIKENKLLKFSEIEKIDRMEKNEKNIYIGKLMKIDKNLVISMMSNLEKLRKIFVKKNRIEDSEILYIKRDSICTINKKCSFLDINKNCRFKEKNKFTSFLYLNKIEFYYSSYDDILTVKGINDKVIESHEKYFINDILSFIKIGEVSNIDSIRLKMKEYRSNYLDLKLDINTYREFNEVNLFRFKNENERLQYYLNYEKSIKCDDRNKKLFDISYNYIHYILPFINFLF